MDMITETITIDSWIKEQYPYLNNEVQDTINNKSKLHVTAPIGSGKTTLAIELIEEYYDEYQVVLLEPQISITQQVKEKLEQKGIHPVIYNSTTKGLIRIDKLLGRIDSNVFYQPLTQLTSFLKAISLIPRKPLF